ncbi:sulfotransferase family 2 domain-containing protein [Formosa sp. PL04]|uniref:sulfotransferase family 2 domain-containing protein n=1 Tax=Formosa sp. PL04 TaxID=3081755 RepID=UPI002980B172|nr:sulfotransferase family 2 domain-containing protein [Formosa sp. PL04]MDW5287885.1 sulfotransferase family 2 domain-containing protein [Formosa sp. PL04]
MKLFNRKHKINLQSDYDKANIDFDKNLVFIHIPKNAGTAIYKNLGLDNSNHRTVKQYISLFGEKNYDDMFSFAFVRNPFSRFISLYNYSRMDVSYYHNNINPEKAIYGYHMDYEILKNKSLEEAAILLKEGRLQHNPPHVQWNPQSFWLKDNENKLNVKYLGRLEDLEFDMRNIYNLIGFEHSREVNQINSSSGSKLDYRKLINPSTRQILEEYYKEDLEFFNYDF